MATRIGTTDNPDFEGSNTTVVRNTYTVPLLGQINSGKSIKASHINTLRDFVSTVRNHTHELREYISIDLYGNTGKTVSALRTTSIVKSSNGVVSGDLILPDRNLGEVIQLTHFNGLQTPINNVVSHTHTYNDT